ELVDLIAQFGRNRIAELGVPFLDESEFGLPLLGLDGQCLAQLLVGEVKALGVQAALARGGPSGDSTASAVPATRSKTHLSTREFSENPGHRNELSSSRRNQLT